MKDDQRTKGLATALAQGGGLQKVFVIAALHRQTKFDLLFA